MSILKPLKGIDEGIKTNLESFFLLDYPNYEILFSVAESDDPVIPIVNELMARYPQVQADLLIGAVDFGPNPKINNLIRSYKQASHDWILISDSNTRVTPHHLTNLGHQFKHGVAMQTSIVAGVDGSGIGGLLESTFLNTFYARSVMALSVLGHPCVIGKAMMFRKSILERTGGLRSLKKHIAEDYAAGRKLHLLGFRVQVSQNPIHQHLGNYSFKMFWSRHIRWGRLRKMQTPFGFIVEPLFNSILSGMLGAYAFSKIFHVSPIIFFGAHMAYWFTCDFILSSRVATRPGFSFLPIWVLREFTHFPLWIHIALGNSINWRGKTIVLKRPVFATRRRYKFEDLSEFLRKSDKRAA